jgi:Fe-S cluster biogenesis protein NfuA/nitrite reductase/ring-hydroxylating ferredoxin subunit
VLGAEPRQLVADVERLLDDLEALPDPFARQTATAVVQGLLELYGAGLERIVEEIAAHDRDGELAAALAADELVSHLLLIHGLHPVPVEARVSEALATVTPSLESHGGSVELLGVEGAAVRLRLQGSCSGCPSSSVTLKLAIENAIRKSAPEIEDVIAEEPASAPLLQIELAPREPEREGPGAWEMAGGLPELASRAVVVKEVAGTPLLFLRVSGRAYAYMPGCVACGRSLEDAALAGAELTCAGCGQRYDAMRAGRGIDRPRLHLEPVPLLEGQDGLVRVALPVAV